MKQLFRSHRIWMILIGGFVLFVVFFDNDNILDRIKLKRRIGDLEKQKEYYQQRISEDSALMQNLRDDIFLEKYAREKFLMKRPGETLFIVEE